MAKEEHFLEMLTDVTPIEPVRAIAERYRGVLPMAVASGGYREVIGKTIRFVGITDWFDAMVCAEDTARHKPEPDVFLEAARRLGVADPTKCVVFEDTDIGLEAARLAGMLGILQAGAGFVPLDPRHPDERLAWVLQDAGCDALVTQKRHLGRVERLGLHHVLCLDDAHPSEPTLVLRAESEPRSLAYVVYTSGSTGRPKGAVLTHGSMTWNTVNFLAHVDVLSTDKALCIAPLFHCVGLGQVTLPTLFKGGSVEVLPKADPGLVLARVSEAGITSFSAVPTMLKMMCEHPSWDSADLS